MPCTCLRRLQSHDHTVHSLITMYSNLGCPRTARRAFDGIPQRDVVSCNSMIKAYERPGMADDVARMFGGAQRGRVLGRWLDLEDWVKSVGIEVGSLVSSALVGMYEKCGEMAEARRVFDGIAVKDTIAWNAMIIGQVHTERHVKGSHFLMSPW